MTTAFPQGALDSILRDRIAVARAHHALSPIETEKAFVEQGGVGFVVRAVSSLARKHQERVARTSRAGNPFSPWDPALFVADVSDTHVALLNKYPVLERHLLIVTREFVHQEMLLDERDFAAIGRCISEIDGLGFYNGGEQAGASQTHKHLQLVPLSLGMDAATPPVQPLLDSVDFDVDGVGEVPGFGFRHAVGRLADLDPAELHARFTSLMRRSGIEPAAGGDELRTSRPYNLLLTRRWMLVVPRRCERWRAISVNALGFAGSLFVRDAEQLEAIRAVGPLEVLRLVSLPNRPSGR